MVVRRDMKPCTNTYLKAKKAVNYAESGDEDDEDEDAFNPSMPARKHGRALKRRKTSPSPDADDFVGEVESDVEEVDEGTMAKVKQHAMASD